MLLLTRLTIWSDLAKRHTFARNIGGNVINLKLAIQDHLKISKRIIKSLPTIRKGCYDTLYYGKKSCIEDEATKTFAKNAGCILPWMKLLQPSLEICKNQDTIFDKALEEYLCAMREITDTNFSYNETEIENICKAYAILSEKCQNVSGGSKGGHGCQFFELFLLLRP